MLIWAIIGTPGFMQTPRLLRPFLVLLLLAGNEFPITVQLTVTGYFDDVIDYGLF